jgi:hypothetical protein
MSEHKLKPPPLPLPMGVPTPDEVLADYKQRLHPMLAAQLERFRKMSLNDRDELLFIEMNQMAMQMAQLLSMMQRQMSGQKPN